MTGSRIGKAICRCAAVVAITLCCAAVRAQQAADAYAVVAEVDRVARQPLWPGFAPQQVPVAIYDGKRTFLFRHHHPPDGFKPLEGPQGGYVFDGLYSAVRADTSVDMNGERTATVMLGSGPELPLRKRAALLIHEMFHVYEREHHRDWAPNEAELFLYPVEDVNALALRRLETAALLRALAAADEKTTRCWIGAALRFRWERFAALPKDASAYERSAELNEGLAQYLQNTADGSPPSLTREDLPAADIRMRSYAVGPVLAILLDRLEPGWKRVLEAGPTRPLDELLRAAPGGDVNPVCDATADEKQQAATRAASDVRQLRDQKTALRREFFAQPGWSVVIVAAPGAPLNPAGFDPMNVTQLQPGEVLHKRFLKLANNAGSVETLNHGALSEAAGSHPLFGGVKKLIVPGLGEEPQIESAGGRVKITAPSLQAEFKPAQVTRSGREIVVTLQ